MTTHLLASSIFLLVFLVGILSIPSNFAVKYFELPGWAFTGFLSASLAVGAVYYVANVKSSWKSISSTAAFLRFLVLFPLFLCLSMGLSLHNMIAVIQGYIGKKSPFVRTPKFAVGDGHEVTKNTYRSRKIKWTTIGEGLLGLIYLVTFVVGVSTGYTYFSIFHAMLAFGFLTIFFISLKHTFAGPSTFSNNDLGGKNMLMVAEEKETVATP